ncbi:hypothetical protein, partial [Nocardia abscessus]|uniref:hypothetical protein n=1 Tax=Nocardia abscessus TaxID=120957 RepID=UPI0024560345
MAFAFRPVDPIPVHGRRKDPRSRQNAAPNHHTTSEVPAATVLELFSEQVRARPDDPAEVFDGGVRGADDLGAP